MDSILARMKRKARELKVELYALLLASRDPRVPWHAKALVLLTIAYALSPIDLIPDFIPVLGYLDDLIIVPLGIALSLRLIPAEVLAECRARAMGVEGRTILRAMPIRWLGLAVVLVVWLGLLSLIFTAV